MSPIDVVIFFIILILMYVGARRGIVNEILGLTGWIIAILLALKYCERLAPRITAAVPEMGQISMVLAFIAIFAGIRVILYIFVFFFKKALNPRAQTGMDKLAGGFLGTVQGLLLVCLIILVFDNLHMGSKFRNAAEKSYLYAKLSRLSYYMVDGVTRFIPQTQGLMDHLKHKVDQNETMESLKEAAQDPGRAMEKSVEAVADHTQEAARDEATELYEKEKRRLDQMKKESRR